MMNFYCLSAITTLCSFSLALGSQHGNKALPESSTFQLYPLSYNDIQGKDYNPDACGRSWISYVENDVHSIMARMAWKSKHYTPPAFETDVTIRSVKTVIPKLLWTTASTQCDEVPRVISIGETMTTVMTAATEGDARYLFNGADSPWGSGLPPPPVCAIQLNDCQTQWTRLQEHFGNWNITVAEVMDPGGVLHCDFINQKHPENGCPADHILDINGWISYRDYIQTRNFFGGCPQPEQGCVAQGLDVGLDKNLPEAVVQARRKDSVLGCNVHAERFVLIRFPSSKNQTRQLCGLGTNEDFAADSAVDNTMPISTATLKSIVFKAKDPNLFGSETAYSRNRWGFPLSLPTIPASTMFGDWTFTSPSVYLAFDTIAADGWCSHPGRTLKNSILTLHPSELYSIVPPASKEVCGNYTHEPTTWPYVSAVDTYCEERKYVQSRHFNLADLENPVPSRAYFDALPSKWRLEDPEIERVPDCAKSICDHFYFPTIAMPTMITDIEPAFKSCYPFNQDEKFLTPEPLRYGVWDPDIVLSIAPAIVTPVAMALKGSPTSAAVPGAVQDPPGSPATSRAQPSNDLDPDNPNIGYSLPIYVPSTAATALADGKQFPDEAVIFTMPSAIAVGTDGKQFRSPVAVITAPSGILTAYVISRPHLQNGFRDQDQGDVQIGSEIIRVGGSPLVTAGEVFTLDSNGQLKIGSTQTIQLPPTRVSSTSVLNIDGKPLRAVINGAPNGKVDSIIIGTLTLQPGGLSATIGNKVLTLADNGILLEGSKPVGTFTQLLGQTSTKDANELSSTDGSVRPATVPEAFDKNVSPAISSEESATARLGKPGSRKKSEGHPQVDLFPFALTVAGLAFGIGIRLL